MPLKLIITRITVSEKILKRLFGAFNPTHFIRQMGFSLLNRQRQQYDRLDYITLNLPVDMPDLPEHRPLFRRVLQGEPPLSLNELERVFRRIADDPRPEGVILYLRGFNLSLADLQTLRDSISRLRARGKRVICYAHNYDTITYYVASAADEIIIQPGGTLMTLGLRQNVLFLKDALASIGVEVEAIQITPYKSALDSLARDAISPEAEAQVNWLLDSTYEIITEGIAAGRKLTREQVQQMIDTAPHLGTDAHAAGYVDAVLNEEALVHHLNTRHIVNWKQADKQVYVTWRKPTPRYIALLKITGMIVPGESRTPPGDIPVPVFGGEAAGDMTVVQQVRRLMDDERAAAVIVYIDSPGGDAAASEAMASALDELAKDRPVIVYMNSVAASGGYYVATPARWIVAQPGTITGSIGVISGKAISAEAYKKLRINWSEYQRGANASLLSDTAPFTEEQRQKQYEFINHIYGLFTQRVAQSRGMTPEAVDAIAGGRVWTGQQAFEHGLVDELGDLRTAFDKARALAHLPEHTPLMLVRAKGEPMGPKLAEKANPAAGLRYVYRNAKGIYNGQAQLLLPFILE